MTASTDLIVCNRCGWTQIDPTFRPVIAAAVGTYVAIWGDRLTAVHLVGSVPRGDAIPGRSDLDLDAIVRGGPGAEEITRLQADAAALEARFPVVTRIELDVEPPGDLHPFRRFVLASDSICVHGVDHVTVPVQCLERGALANLVTPDPVEMVAGYRAGVAEVAVGDDAALLSWSRIVGKDLLKGVRFVVLRRGGEYEPGIAAIHAQVPAFAPDLIAPADALFALYREPTTDRARILAAIDLAEALILPAVVACR